MTTLYDKVREDLLEKIRTGAYPEGETIPSEPELAQIYGVSRASVGQDFLTVDRSRDMSCAIADAVKNGHSEVRSERGGRGASRWRANGAGSLPTGRQRGERGRGHP